MRQLGVYLRGMERHTAQVVDDPHGHKQERGQLQQPCYDGEDRWRRRADPVAHWAAGTLAIAESHAEDCYASGVLARMRLRACEMCRGAMYTDVFGIAMSLQGRRGFLPLRRAGPISMGSLSVLKGVLARAAREAHSVPGASCKDALAPSCSHPTDLCRACRRMCLGVSQRMQACMPALLWAATGLCPYYAIMQDCALIHACMRYTRVYAAPPKRINTEERH